MATIKTQGTVITIENNLAAAQTIGGHTTISDLESGEASEIDVTNLASTAKEFELGLVDNGSFTLECITDLADVGQAAAEEARTSGESREMVITLVSGDIATFEALVKAAPKSGGVDDVWRTTYSIRINGAIAWT